jgi:hypothetical protein
MRKVFLLLLLLVLPALASAAALQTTDGLRLSAELPGRITGVRIDGMAASQSEGGLSLIDPRTGHAPLAGQFTLSASTRQEASRIVVSGVVTATGGQETVCQLQARIPVGESGWLFWDDMTRSRPVRVGESFVQSVYPICCLTDPTKRLGLAVALDPDPLQPASLSYDPASRAIIVNWRLGFTPLARPELRMKAPFRFDIYRVLSKWAFRSALDSYYHFHPAQYDWRAKREGLWLFASGSETLPNPQHYAYDEGGPPPSNDIPRGIATFPYCCTGDMVVQLPVEWGLAKSYDDMLARLARWEKLPRLDGWDILSPFEVDEAVAHTGQRSLKFSSAKPGETKEIRQTLDLQQKKIDPLTVSVWCKTAGVTGTKDADCGLWVDMDMMDGSGLRAATAPADPGTHDWQQLKVTVGVDKPIANARIYLLFRNNHSGTAWFDDASATLASDPARNLLQSAGFEYSGPPRESTLLRDDVMFDENDHMRWFTDTFGGADIPPASPINWIRYTLLVNSDQRNPGGRPTASDVDFGKYAKIFADNPQCAGAYMDGTSAACTTTFEYRRDHFQWFRDPFQYLGTIYRPCASGKASVCHWVDAFKHRFPGKLAFGNVWASNSMWDVCAALDVCGYESSRYYDLDYADYYRAAAYHKPGLLLNYFRIGQYLDTREGGERFFRYATAYGLFPSIGRYTDEAYEKFGDLQHLYVPIVKRLFRAGWEPITYAEASDPNVRVQRFGEAGKLPMYFTLLNPGPTPREVTLAIDAKALGLAAARLSAVEMVGSALLPGKGIAQRQYSIALGPDDVAVIAMLPAGGEGAWYRERAAETLQEAAYVYAQTPPTVDAAALAQRLRAFDEKAGAVRLARGTNIIKNGIARLREAAAKLPDDLKRRSFLRDTAEADRLLNEALFADTEGIDLPSAVVTPVDGRADVKPLCFGSLTVLDVSLQAWPGRLIELPSSAKSLNAMQDVSLELTAPPERVTTVGAEVVFQDASGAETHLTRRSYVFFGPVCELQADSPPGSSVLNVHVRNCDTRARSFRVEIAAPPEVAPERNQLALKLSPGQGRNETVRLQFGAGLRSGSYPMKVTVRTESGISVEETTVPVVYVLPLAPGDLALPNNGTTVLVDSAYYGYDEKPLNDGVVLPTNQAFNVSAWASGEATEDHWVELRWPQPQTVGKVVVYWNVENGVVWTSKRFLVQVRDGETWRTLAESLQPDAQPVTECAFAPVQTKALRILQPKGEGPATRPHIMWLREVAAYGK